MLRLIVSLCIGFLCMMASAQAEPMSITVGRVGDHIVTSREVRMQILLEKLLFENANVQNVHFDALETKAFVNATNDTILEQALAMEAKSLNVIPADEQGVQTAEARVTKELVNAPAWKQLEPAPAEWKALLENKLKSKQFIKFRRDSSQLPVSDTEAKRYYDENRLKFGNLPFENFKDNIKSFLARSQVDRRLKDWYEIVKAKYQARNFLAEL